ncbi:MAG: PEP/pyruvate-binding domain-containing protein [Acidimicrobiia bacterium]
MLLSLDDPAALEPRTTGAKAAWLARARQAGLPVLDGFVVTSEHSAPFLQEGMAHLDAFGSGRARMAITSQQLPSGLTADLAEAAAGFIAPLVVRSSSALEGSGVWSGAFTSYLDIKHSELPKAVVGCYASVFTQATVERFTAAGSSPAQAVMAVLVQPALSPDFGGTAQIQGDDVVIIGVKGSPVPLVQGWDPGVQAIVNGAGVMRGAAAAELLGEDVIRRVAETVRRAQQLVGANNCEWAVQGDDLWLLQVQRFAVQAGGEGLAADESLRTDEAAALGRLIRRFPGPLGESLVLPWAVADPSIADVAPTAIEVDPYDALQEATAQVEAFTAEVWGLPKPLASAQSRETLRMLRGPEPASALSRLGTLRPPDAARAAEILGLLATVRAGLVAAGAVADSGAAWHVAVTSARRAIAPSGSGETWSRIGFDRWEPFNAALVAAHGTTVTGTSAASGVAFGRMCVVATPAGAAAMRPRDVIVGVHPVPGLAALLFDAAALITTGGGPAAHLFESARSLGIPALCATRVEDLIGCELTDVAVEWALAVDGNAGVVHGVEW